MYSVPEFVLVTGEADNNLAQIVHRIVRKHGVGPDAKILTKGDNNAGDDTELFVGTRNRLTAFA